MDNGTVITSKGIELLAQLIASKGTLNFTRVAVGTGKFLKGYNPANMLDLVEYKMDAVLSKVEATDKSAKVTMQLTSQNIENSFIITEAGVYAETLDGTEILYAYIDLSDDPQYMYENGEQNIKTIEIALNVLISDSVPVHTYISPNGLVNRGDFDNHVNDDVAHVTAEERVKWNGKMETTGDSAENTITFSSADILNPTALEEIPLIQSGEKHKSFLTKFSQVVKNFRYLYNLLGDNDISKIGDGTITGALANINSNLRANNAGNAVSLSKSDYIARSDGYVVAYTSDANSAVTVDVLDSQNGHFGSIRAVYANNTHGIAMVYVREGMIVRVSSSSGQYVAEFRPIV